MSPATTTEATVVDLAARHLGFDWGGTVRAHDHRAAADDPDWRLATFRAETDADVHAELWERHPEGDEAVCCLTGGIRVHLRAEGAGDGGPDDVLAVGPGQAAIVPRGRWHRLTVVEPSDLLVVTTRLGTQRERR